MKKLLTLLSISVAINVCFAQQSIYEVTAGNGNGIRFWQSDGYKIHMGSGTEYFYGPVTDYSIKSNMGGGTTGRGWTWGNSGSTPIAALNLLGNMQIAGSFISATLQVGNDNSYVAIDAQPSSRLGFVKKFGMGPVIASDSGNPIIFSQSNQTGINTNISSATLTERMRIEANGNVGIGTTSPSQKLDVAGNINMAGSAGRRLFMGGIGGTTFGIAYDANYPDYGIFYTEGAIDYVSISPNGNANNGVMNVFGNGNVGIGTTSPQSLLHLNSTVDARKTFRVHWNNDLSKYLSIWQGTGGAVIDPIGTGILQLGYDQVTTVSVNGAMAIGTANPGSYKLAVEGKIGAREVNVTTAASWPDYVFEKNYKLPSLEEIKNYIDQNQHLPEVPSAKEVEKNGVNLGEMNALLLKKIEELTLYVIELKKENEALHEQASTVKKIQEEIQFIKKELGRTK